MRGAGILALAAAALIAAGTAGAQSGRSLTGEELRRMLEAQRQAHEAELAVETQAQAPTEAPLESPSAAAPGVSEGPEPQIGAPIPTPPPPPSVEGTEVVLRGLDKLTGDLSETTAAVGATARLWRLEIDVKACNARPEAGSSDASAFLQIRDTKPDPAETVFSGWMFAASPALSAMDHPRYDVWLLSCKIS